MMTRRHGTLSYVQVPYENQDSRNDLLEGSSGQRYKQDLTSTTRHAYYDQWKTSGLSKSASPHEVRDWSQTWNLSRDENYLLDPRIRSVCMGIGWDKGCDVDASAMLLDKNLRLVGVVWYRQLKSRCKSVEHSGDNTTGKGSGIDEAIRIRLDTVPIEVHHVVLAVSVYTYDMSLRDIRNAFVQMIHGEENAQQHVLCAYRLSDMSSNSIVIGQLTRKGGYWNFKALAIPSAGRTAKQIQQDTMCLKYLALCPSVAPSFRRITVHVVKGTNLSAKDGGVFFRKNGNSDPYYTMRYKKQSYTSEHRPRTLNPVWKAKTLDLGMVMESETKALKIAVFDYDVISRDEFMGMVRIPVGALYHSGPGTHKPSFELGPSKERRWGKEEVSGALHLIVTVRDVTGHDWNSGTLV